MKKFRLYLPCTNPFQKSIDYEFGYHNQRDYIVCLIYFEGYYYQTTFYTVHGVKSLGSKYHLIEMGLIIIQEISKEILVKTISETIESLPWFFENLKGLETINLDGWIEINIDEVLVL